MFGATRTGPFFCVRPNPKGEENEQKVTVQLLKNGLRRQGGGTLKPYGKCMAAVVLHMLSGHSRDV